MITFRPNPTGTKIVCRLHKFKNSEAAFHSGKIPLLLLLTEPIGVDMYTRAEREHLS
jgi:hypothetical protein